MEEELKEREVGEEVNEQWSNGERNLEELREIEDGFEEAVKVGALNFMDIKGDTEDDNEAIILFFCEFCYVFSAFKPVSTVESVSRIITF